MSRMQAAAWVVLLTLTSSTRASDWPRFRGPNGSGVSPDPQPTPVKWSPTENLQWKTPLPGPGASSPIIVGDRLFVTCWSGYGVERGFAGFQEELKLHLLCLDRRTGQITWDRTVDANLPEDRYGGMIAEHGYASHTPVCDGKRVYAYFGKTGAVAFDLDGAKLWQTNVGIESDRRGWGTASSPIEHGDLVFVTAAIESQSLVALDKQTGKEVWRKEAKGFANTWGTPVLAKVDEQRTDLVLGVPYELWAFDPQTGKLRWYCDAMEDESYCSSVVTADGIVYGVEGRGGGGAIAVRAGGSGNVTKTHRVWQGRDTSRIVTPILHDGRLHFIANRVAGCLDAATGSRLFQSRLTTAGADGGSGRGGRGGQDYASPVAADGKIYFITRSGDMHVYRLADQFSSLAVNRVTDAAEDFSATPAISEGAIYIRSSKQLYCVALPPI